MFIQFYFVYKNVDMKHVIDQKRNYNQKNTNKRHRNNTFWRFERNSIWKNERARVNCNRFRISVQTEILKILSY